jgi:cbb3-type cytochrome oxidase maturation protein
VDALYLLIPLSVVLILAIGGLLVWAAMSGQFESLDEEGRRILDDDGRRCRIVQRGASFDLHQARVGAAAYDPLRLPSSPSDSVPPPAWAPAAGVM